MKNFPDHPVIEQMERYGYLLQKPTWNLTRTRPTRREGSVSCLGTNKFGAKQIITEDGLKFDSKKEHKRYCELKLLERAGKISGLVRQPRFELIPTQYEPDTIGPRGGVRKGAV